MTAIKTEEYLNYLSDLKAKIRDAQYEALKQVNKTLLNLYWEIGKSIVESKKSLAGAKR